MPVRKIPKNYLGVTGGFSSAKNGRMLQFESPLERDYMILLEFDPHVMKFEEQPVKIPFKKGSKPYVPDLLIHYSNAPPALVEVKTLEDLIKNEILYAPKFEKAVEFANARGWDFRILTEKEIRVPRLGTLKFLRSYAHSHVSLIDIDRVINALRVHKGSLPMNRLLDSICSGKNERLNLISVVWNLVLKNIILIDYDRELSDTTLLTLGNNYDPI